jgi:hypothetical protein
VLSVTHLDVLAGYFRKIHVCKCEISDYSHMVFAHFIACKLHVHLSVVL